MTLASRLPLHDRREAGQLLVAELDALRSAPDLLVVALPRGGVPVGYEVARALDAPLDVCLVHRIDVPGQPGEVLGAVSSGGVHVIDPQPPGCLPPQQLQAVLRDEMQALASREQVYRGLRPPCQMQARTVLLVDDGMASGVTMETAVRTVRLQRPCLLAVATPVASLAAARRLRPLVDLLVCGAMPEPFGAIGRWYRDFAPCTDDDVQALLEGPVYS